ncbi:MAG TPA: trigger factor [Stellaceae bacterium]|nr:trigger factor [Stellaceae bacterium]
MEVIETSADGLKREFKIVVPAGEIEDKITRRLDELGRTIRLPGFRPGKVPIQLLRRRFGNAVFGEVLGATLEDSTSDALKERNLRPALPPKVDIVASGEGADLEYKLSLELLPDIPQTDFADLEIERLVAEVPQEDIDKAVARIAEQQGKVEAVDRPAAQGDILLADVEARVGEEEIPGGGGTDRRIELGAGHFVPGFEEQLEGAAAGETRTVRVTFPEDYAAANLAGKEAVFTVAVKEVQHREPLPIDDELGRAVGLENLAELKDEVRQRMQRDWDMLARQRLKRALLDKLAERYDFPVPPGMVDIELENLVRQDAAATERTAVGGEGGTTGEATVAEEKTEAEGGENADAGTTEADPESLKATYRPIAERRVRLGLLLAEIGRSNNITVTQEELNQALVREASMHPGYERRVLDFYRQNPEAVGNLRAPILEDKVIDFIVELAKVDERKVSPQELLAEAQAEGGDDAA